MLLANLSSPLLFADVDVSVLGTDGVVEFVGDVGGFLWDGGGGTTPGLKLGSNVIEFDRLCCDAGDGG